MEGKLFYGDAALPTAAENTDFFFDLQRFAVTDDQWTAGTSLADGTKLSAAEIAGYSTQQSDTLIKLEYTPTGQTTKVTKYFKYMQSALNAVLGNQVSDESNTYEAGGTGSNYNENGDATITLLGNITAGDGFTIGRTRSGGTGTKATKVTINLDGYEYQFAYQLTAANAGVEKEKAIATSSDADSSVTINGGTRDGKHGTFSIASNSQSNFERLMRTYMNTTLNDVVIDGTTLSTSQQTADVDGAVVCHSKGTLNIIGDTSILANDGYYALSDKAGFNHIAGATVNINTTGTISNFGLFEWSGAAVASLTTALSNTSVSIGGGNIGDVVLSPTAVSLGAATRMTVSGGTVNSVDMTDTTGQNFLYYADDNESLINTRATTNAATSHLVNGVLQNIGVAGWNPSDTKGKFSFIGASIGADATTHAGSRILTVTDTGETNTSAFGWDATNYALGIPTVGTVTWNDGDDTTKSAYSIARTKYDRNQEAVTLTAVELGDSLGYAKIVEKADVAASSGLLASTVKKIDASAVTVAASIVGNALDNTIYAGTGANSLVGGGGKDVFVYTKGADVIADYAINTDKVTLTDTGFVPSGDSIKVVGSDLQIAFGANDSLTFSGQGTLVADSVLPTRGIEIESKGKSYIYTAYSVADISSVKGGMLSGVTLASNFTGSDFAPSNSFVTISGAEVGGSLNITGTAGANYIAAGKAGGSLNGGGGDDTLVGGAGGDVFVYEKGKAVIDGYDKAGDKLALSINESVITGAKVNTKDQLIFSADNKANSITFNAVDSGAVEAVSLESGGVFTKDGKFKDNKLTLFKDTKGRVETTDPIYSGITGIDASAVTGNVITMAGAAAGGEYKFANNKKADVFEYAGGSVTLSGYVADSDKIDLGAYSFTSFTANSSGVSLATSISGGSSTGQIVLEGNYTTGEVLLHDDERNKRNQYSKFVFATDNVLQDKATRPTSATVFGGATLYDARTTGGNTVKNIVLDSRTTGASIQAGNVNTNIDASNAGTTGVSLVSGTHNDKFTGSKGNDLFVYTAGKDVINGYASGDSISLEGFGVGDIAKVSKSGKSITFKFDNKNSLAVKSDSAIDKININGADYTFAKKGAIISSGESGSVASLTSGFSGTYTADSSATSIIGSAVTKNLTIKGQKNADDYIIAGEGKKTKLQGQGGNDTLVGGSGKGEDTFFYKKGETGNISVQKFGAGEDKIKISGSKVVSSLSTDTTKALSITMSNGAVITVDSFKPDSGNTAETKTIGQILIKANNTGYWFDKNYEIEGTTDKGAWVTSVDKISNSAMKNSAFTVVDLGYGTNLVKAGLAYKTDTSFSSVSPTGGTTTQDNTNSGGTTT